LYVSDIIIDFISTITPMLLPHDDTTLWKTHMIR